MRGIAINFASTGPVIDFQRMIFNFGATVQNVMVTLATDKISDPVFPDRGTNLMKDALSGKIASVVLAGHSGNFASLDAVAFSQKTEIPSNPHKLRNIRLLPKSMRDQRLEFLMQATGSTGEILGGLAKF